MNIMMNEAIRKSTGDQVLRTLKQIENRYGGNVIISPGVLAEVISDAVAAGIAEYDRQKDNQS